MWVLGTEHKLSTGAASAVLCCAVLCCAVLLLLLSGFLCIVLAVLELDLYTRLALNSEICLPLPPECWD